MADTAAHTGIIDQQIYMPPRFLYLVSGFYPVLPLANISLLNQYLSNSGRKLNRHLSQTIEIPIQ